MKASNYTQIYKGKFIEIFFDPTRPVLDIYGNSGWNCASMSDESLKELIVWLKENKPELFE